MKLYYTAIFIAFYSCFLCLNATGQSQNFEVTQYPEAAYINEQNLFIVKTQPKTKISIYLDDKILSEHISPNNILEINLILTTPGILRFQEGSKSIHFHLITPSDSTTTLSEKMGYLYSKKGPAILLTKHLHPPKHSRKWETIKLFLAFFKDTRPKISSGTLITSKLKENINAQENIDANDFPEKFWQHIEITNTVTWINGLAIIATSLPPTDLAVIALSKKDLARATDETQLRIKLEWCLQALQHISCTHLLVIPPYLSEKNAKCFPDIQPAISLSAAGNSAHFAHIPKEGKKPNSMREWLSFIAVETKTWLKW